MSKKIGVLALQGAFIEHEKMLNWLGAECIELRQEKDLHKEYQAILQELSMYQLLKEQIDNGMPVMGTCAGMILLVNTLKCFPGEVKRNAYGRQLGSFKTSGYIDKIGRVPMTFIRAPYMPRVGENVEILARVDGRIVAAEYKNQLALAFHPEVTEDTGIHKYFLEKIK